MRFLWHILLAIGLLGLAGSPDVNAAAMESAADFLQPTISRQDYQFMLNGLNLDSQQRVITDLLYGDYAGAMDRLFQRTDAQANTAGRQRAEDALAGKIILNPVELTQIRVAVLEVYEQAIPESDRLRRQLIDDTRVMLLPDQISTFEKALVDLRRLILLHPRQSESLYPEYAGDGVDVLILFEQAREPGGELENLSPDAVASILNRYELQLDQLLLNTSDEYRRGKIHLRIARMKKDQPALINEQCDALTRWQQLYQLNQQTVRAVADVVEPTLGQSARKRWLERFSHASFVWLYSPRLPDREYQWINSRSMSPEVHTQAREIYQQYQKKRQRLTNQAVDLMLRGRLEHKIMLYAMMDPTRITGNAQHELYQQLLKNSGELATLEANTTSQLEDLLSHSQLQTMQHHLRSR